MIDLKPCPFCGYTAVNMICVPKTAYFVSCRKCRADGPICQTVEAAANLWNECDKREKKKMSKCGADMRGDTE